MTYKRKTGLGLWRLGVWLVASLSALSLAHGAYAAPEGPALRLPGQLPASRSDEANLWAVMEAAEQAAKGSPDRIMDPNFNAYVKTLTCRLAPEYCGELRVYIMQRPSFNASAAANGYIELWSGLLLRADSEDALGFVLGHEITHYAQNHAIETQRAAKLRSNLKFALSLAVNWTGQAVAANASTVQAANDTVHAATAINELLYLGAIAAYLQYSRNNETEADQAGLERAVRAGLDAKAAARIWRDLIAENQASDFPTRRRQSIGSSIFSTHPINAARMLALSQGAQDTAEASDAQTQQRRRAYRQQIRPFLSTWLRDDLGRRDYGQTLLVIERLSELGEDMGVLNFYRGEALRQRRANGDLAKARAAYQAATLFADAPSQAWRNLGDLALKDGETGTAQSAYLTYLDRAPLAQDRWIITEAIKALNITTGR
jgi:predicted Zn-dependent protease